MVNIVHKHYKFGEITFHYFLFKNIEELEFKELTDNILSLLYESKSTLTHAFINGDSNKQKVLTKADTTTFGDRDWPITWINNADSKTISGYYSAISSSTVKSISTNGFKIKIVDNGILRYGIIGDVINNKNNRIEDVINGSETALAFAGYDKKDIIQSLVCANNLQKEDKVIYNNWIPESVNSFLISNQKHNYSITSEALKAVTNEVKLQAIEEGIVTTSNNNSILKINNTTSFNTDATHINNYFETISHLIAKHNFQWSDLKLGYVFTNDIKVTKQIKQLFKDLKVPLSPILFIPCQFPEKDKQYEFVGEFCK